MPDNSPNIARNLEYQQRILAICQSLFDDFNIVNFAHARVFTDDSVAVIIDNAKLEEDWYKLSCLLSAYLDEHTYLYIYPDNTSSKISREPVKQNHPKPRLYIIHKNINYTDIYLLDAKRKTKRFIAHYLDIMETVQAFLTQYQQKTQSIIQAYIKAYSLLPKADFVLPEPETVTPSLQALFREPYKVITLRLAQGNRVIKLSFNEYACLIGLIQGLSVKELSTVLELSERTLEKYISQIKKKFKCKKLTQLAYLLGKANVDLAGAAKV